MATLYTFNKATATRLAHIAYTTPVNPNPVSPGQGDGRANVGHYPIGGRFNFGITSVGYASDNGVSLGIGSGIYMPSGTLASCPAHSISIPCDPVNRYNQIYMDSAGTVSQIAVSSPTHIPAMIEDMNLLYTIHTQPSSMSYKIDKITPRMMIEKGYPYGSKWTNGIGFVSNTVTIYNPKALRFGEPEYSCPNMTISLADGNGQRVIWAWREREGAAYGLSVLSNAQINAPSDAPPVYMGTICICDCVSGIAKLANTGGSSDNLGHIILLPLFTVGTI